MNVLVFSINYFPEPTGFAPHTSALCEHLASQGHAVTVMTGFPFAPYWSRWPEYRGKFISHERIRNVKVVRITHFIPRRASRMLQRLLMEGSFCLLAALKELFSFRHRWDVIVYVGAQPSLAMLARIVARRYGIPYVVKITDLAAQAAADVSMFKSPALLKVLNRFEYSAYCAANGAIVLCGAFEEALKKRQYPVERIRIIPDSVDLELIRPLSTIGDIRERNQLTRDDFVILYSGSMGVKQGLTNVIEAARLIRSRLPLVKWVLVGDGELMPVLQRQIAQYCLDSQIRLLPLQPEERMSAVFSSADVLLLNQLRNMKDTVIPSKLLTYMAAGRPVLAAVNPSSQAALLLNEAKGGVIVTPEDPLALAASVEYSQKNRAALEKMGRRNRRYAEIHFDRRRIVQAQERFLCEIAGITTGSTAVT